MKNSNEAHRRTTTAIVALISVCAFLLVSNHLLNAAEIEELIAQKDVRPGLLAVVGSSHPEKCAALRSDSKFMVHVLCEDAAIVEKSRAALSKDNAYGTVSVEHHDLKTLPYADDIVNVMIIENAAELQKKGLTIAEILRALAPFGSAFLKGVSADEVKQALPAGAKDVPSVRTQEGWTRVDKPCPSDIDEWSHYFHDASNTAASTDTRVGWPDQLRFVAGRPFAGNSGRWAAALTSANGRNFYVSPVEAGDEAPAKSRTMIECRDAFNGFLLWRRFLPQLPPWLGWSLTGYPADAERVYAGGNDVFTALDVNTGQDAWRIKDAEAAQLSAVLVADGVVVRNGSSVRGYEAPTGKLLWRLDTKGKPSAICVGGGKAFAALARPPDPVEIVCLDLKSGKEEWRVPLPETTESKAVPLWIMSRTPLQYKEGRLYFSMPGVAVAVTAILSTTDGKLLSMNKRVSLMPLCLTKDKVLDSLSTLDPDTGAEVSSVARNGKFMGSCGMVFSSARYLIAGRLGYTDIQTGETRNYQLTRGGCSQGGAIPANGLSNFTRQTCTCFTMLQGHLSFASNVPGREPLELNADVRLEKGPAFATALPPAPEPGEFGTWPTLRHDSARGGCSNDRLPGTLSLAWVAFCGADVTAPVCDGQIVCVATPASHQVKAFNVADGTLKWAFTAGGPVDSPPTLAGGMAVFGCRDGSVYALRADDGRMAWRYTAAPALRRIISFDQLESSWPVIGSVLVQDGVVFAAAGRHTQVDGGLRIVGLDLATGKENWSQRVGGVSRAQAYVNDVLRSDGKRVYLTGFMEGGPMGKFAFDCTTGKPWQTAMSPASTGQLLSAEGGLLVDGRFRQASSRNHTESRRIWWYVPNQTKPVYPSTYSSEVYPLGDATGYRGDLIVFDGQRVFGAMRTIGDDIKDPDFPEHTSNGIKLIVYGPMEKKMEPWCFDPQRSSYDLRGMVATERRLFVAFSGPDAAAPKSTLVSVDTVTGCRDVEIPLLHAPRWDGMAVAAGRLFVATQDGNLMCLWQPVSIDEQTWVFASASKQQRTIRFTSRTMLPSPLTVRWSVAMDGKPAIEASATFTKPADIPATLPIELVIPTVDDNANGTFTLVATSGGKTLCEETHAFHVINGDGCHISKVAATDIVVLDPSGEVKTRLTARGVAFTEAVNIEGISEKVRVVLIGKNALTTETAKSAVWKTLAERGVRLIFMEQDVPLDLAGLGLGGTVVKGELMSAVPRQAVYGWDTGLSSLDFARWNDDGVMCRAAYAYGNGRVHSWLDSPRGRLALIPEIHVGEGIVIASQALLSKRLATDPVCQRLFDNLLAHALSYQVSKAANALSESPRSELLKETPAIIDQAAEPLAALSDGSHNVVVADATPALLKELADKPQTLRTFSERGGWLVLWGLTPESLPDFNRLIGVEHLIRPWEPARIALPEKVDTLLSGLNAADFNLNSALQLKPGLAVPDKSAWTFAVDGDEIAPFCKLPGPEYWKNAGAPNTDLWPRNMVNGFGSQDDWRVGFSMHLDKKPPMDVPLGLPREESVIGIGILPNTLYRSVTRIKVEFDGRQEDALEFEVKPTPMRQDFTFTPRHAKNVVIRILQITERETANVTGIDNVWLRVERSPEFNQRVVPLLNMGLLVKYPMGKGGVILNQMEPQLLHDPLVASKAESDRRIENRSRQKRILTTMLWNLGIVVKALVVDKPEAGAK